MPNNESAGAVHFVEIYYHEKEGTDLDRERLARFLQGFPA